MHGSKVEDDIILSRSKWQVLDRLADVILDESRLQLLTITQSRLVILHYRIRSTRLNDIEVIYLGVRITLLNQICKMGTDEAGTASDNIVHYLMIHFVLKTSNSILFLLKYEIVFAEGLTIMFLYLGTRNKGKSS